MLLGELGLIESASKEAGTFVIRSEYVEIWDRAGSYRMPFERVLALKKDNMKLFWIKRGNDRKLCVDPCAVTIVATEDSRNKWTIRCLGRTWEFVGMVDDMKAYAVRQLESVLEEILGLIRTTTGDK